MLRRLTTIAALALAVLAVTASSGAAATPGGTRILGVVQHTSRPAVTAHALLSRVAAADATPTKLTFDSSYETLINRYFADVAHDSGGPNNVYSVATQYNDGSGNIKYQSTFGGSYVDKNPLPANGCNDGVSTYCITDAQLQQQIQAVMAAKGWSGNAESDLTHIFFLMTPEGVASCEFAGSASNANPCSTNFFCAYHSDFTNGTGQAVVYANEPYLGADGGCAGPDQGFPNDVDADTTINTISHEQNESITDPFGDAWLANDGPAGSPEDEVADLCAYGFGTQSGGFNQTINGHHYELQQEYSNQDTGCVQKLGGTSTPPTSGSGPVVYHGGPVMHTNTTYAIYWLPTAGNTSAPTVSGTPGVNRTLTTTHGTWSDGATAYSYQWQRCSAAGTGCANIAGARAAKYTLTAADDGHTVRSSVTATNVNGASLTAATSHVSTVVTEAPIATKLPHISGKAKVGKRLTASKGAWTGSPKAYSFQWLRCNGGGSSCKAIGHATKPKYKLTKKDAKHRLRVRVTASNTVGKKSALSRATARVPAKR